MHSMEITKKTIKNSNKIGHFTIPLLDDPSSGILAKTFENIHERGGELPQRQHPLHSRREHKLP